MKLQKQKYRHVPDIGQFGDCHRTALAMVLGIERDDVPHFLHDGCEHSEFRKRVRDYLAQLGLAEVGFPVGGKDITPDLIMECLSVWSEDTPVVLGGTSRTGCNHSVVVFKNQLLDPSLNDSGIIGPCDDGFYWCSMLVPLQGWSMKPPMHLIDNETHQPPTGEPPHDPNPR